MRSYPCIVAFLLEIKLLLLLTVIELWLPLCEYFSTDTITGVENRVMLGTNWYLNSEVIDVKTDVYIIWEMKLHVCRQYSH